jgi:hypothetical protein
MALLGAAVIGGGIAVTHKNPYKGSDVKGAIGMGPAPTLKPPPVMPDLATLTQAQTLQESKDAALRYGRASTVLTNTGAENTTGDKLGP